MFYPLIKLHYKPIQFLLKSQVKIVWCSVSSVLLVRKRWYHQRFPVVEHFQKGVEAKKVVLHLTTKQIQKNCLTTYQATICIWPLVIFCSTTAKTQCRKSDIVYKQSFLRSAQACQRHATNSCRICPIAPFCFIV